MKKRVFKIMIGFLLLMLILAFLSWKLDMLRTPKVVLAEPVQASINGKNYSCVLPRGAVYRENEKAYIYIPEKTNSPFYSVVARRVEVKLEDEEGIFAAVSGIYVNGLHVVHLSSRPVMGSDMPVEIVEEPQTLEGRVEVLAWENREAVEEICTALFPKNPPVWEEDRLVFREPTMFTAQQIQAILQYEGLENVLVLDYSWAGEVLQQSGTLWQPVAAIMALCLLVWMIRRQLQTEWKRGRIAMQKQYPAAYLSDAAVRLLSKAILLIVSVFASVLLIRYLIRFPMALPPTLLPQSRLFQVEQYRMWQWNTFPEGICSAYAQALGEELRQQCWITGLECAGLILLTCIVRFGMGRRKQSHNRNAVNKGEIKKNEPSF